MIRCWNCFRLFTWLLLSAFLACPQAFADELQGKVVGILDGDTFDMLDNNSFPRRIRIAGIDAPERAQPFSDASRQYLAQLIFGKTVVVHWYKLSYKRLVGNVFVDGKDVGLELVRAGLAWHYKDYEHEQSDDARVQYAIAEVRARSAKRGLWQQRDPLAPWEYRHGRRIVITPEAEATAPPR